MTTVLTIGTFDPVHADHVYLFRRCAALGELTVGVNSDSFVEFYRHKSPIFSQDERMAQVEATGYRAVLNDGSGRDLIYSLQPHILAIGSDWLRRDYFAQLAVNPDDLEELGVGLLYLPRGVTISASELKERCRRA